MRLIAAAVLALGLALAGCGDGGGEDGGAASPSEILSEAAAALDAHTLAFSFEYVRTRADRLDEPERLVTIALEPARSGGKLVLPARTVRVTYDLGSYGEPVTGLEFESQAG